MRSAATRVIEVIGQTLSSRCDSGGLGNGSVSSGDGGAPDAGIAIGDRGVSPDTGLADAGRADTGMPTGDAGTPPACALGQLACAGGCVDALVDPLHCGACDTA